MKNTIFTYFNFQINSDIPRYQHDVIEKLTLNQNIDFNPLFFNAEAGDQSEGKLYPDDVINYGLNELFYNQGYDNVLILDVDCIPLNIEALQYTFNRATEVSLIGNAQRSHYLQNNEHIFIGSSCLCINRSTYETLGKPSAAPTPRGDIAEEFMYLSEQRLLPTELYVPDSYEESPYGATDWALTGDMKHYGIGTTFVRQHDMHPMFYHLFESRTNLHIDKFINKCKTILDT